MRQSHKLLAFGFLVLTVDAIGYKEYTHSLMSQSALDRSVISTDLNLLPELDLGASARDPNHLLPVFLGDPEVQFRFSPAALVFQGAIDEDAGTRSFHHFMDPQQDYIPLTVGATLGRVSANWALEHDGEYDAQARSYRDAKRYFYSALTGPEAFQRDVDLGSVFYALGHVIHHVQDMAQPQHVRNDDHCDKPACRPILVYKPSAYEDFTYQRGRELPLGNYGTVDYATFEHPIELWAGDGLGIGEFTSNNFVSIGTNFYEHAGFMLSDPNHPKPRGAIHNPRQVTDSDILGPVGPNQPLTGEIHFVGTSVIDNYRGLVTTNARASTYSIFDKELREAGATQVFTLNRLNYAVANDFLLPRAAAYSTGLINYFFRGRIEIGLPADGVYGVIDHATTYAAGQGFGKLKLKLRNASADDERPLQTMEGGTLVAIAKYTLNSCYMPDLTGDFAATLDTGAIIYPANCTLNQYFAGEEQIAQSAAMLGTTLTTTAAEFEFDFGSQPIPVNARDLRIQVVYTGQLGAEADGIAFGGRDISEPTHIVVYNNSDYYAVDGKFYTPAQIHSDPTLTQRTQGQVIDPRALRDVSLAFAAGRFVAGPSTQPVGATGYLRVAVLAERDQTFDVRVRLRFEGGSLSTSTFAGIIPATIDLRGEVAYITAFGLWRGMRVHMVDVAYRAADNVPLGENELAVMSTRDVPDPGPTQIPVGF